MSFLYVEPYEVRHEILTRVKDMAQWLDLGLRGDRYIEVDELEPLKQRIGEFLLRKNPLRIDGKPPKPILDRTNYIKVGLSGIQLIEQPERLEISTAIVGVIIAYMTGTYTPRGERRLGTVHRSDPARTGHRHRSLLGLLRAF